MACSDIGSNFLLTADLATETAANAVIILEIVALGLDKLPITHKEYLGAGHMQFNQI